MLDAKNPKHATYLEKCDLIWLVINVGFGTISAEFDVPGHVVDHEYESPFDRIYLVSQSRSQWSRLTISASE